MKRTLVVVPSSLAIAPKGGEVRTRLPEEEPNTLWDESGGVRMALSSIDALGDIAQDETTFQPSEASPSTEPEDVVRRQHAQDFAAKVLAAASASVPAHLSLGARLDFIARSASAAGTVLEVLGGSENRRPPN